MSNTPSPFRIGTLSNIPMARMMRSNRFLIHLISDVSFSCILVHRNTYPSGFGRLSKRGEVQSSTLVATSDVEENRWSSGQL